MNIITDSEEKNIDTEVDILDVLERMNVNFNYFDWFAE